MWGKTLKNPPETLGSFQGGKSPFNQLLAKALAKVWSMRSELRKTSQMIGQTHEIAFSMVRASTLSLKVHLIQRNLQLLLFFSLKKWITT